MVQRWILMPIPVIIKTNLVSFALTIFGACQSPSLCGPSRRFRPERWQRDLRRTALFSFISIRTLILFSRLLLMSILYTGELGSEADRLFPVRLKSMKPPPAPYSIIQLPSSSCGLSHCSLHHPVHRFYHVDDHYRHGPRSLVLYVLFFIFPPIITFLTSKILLSSFPPPQRILSPTECRRGRVGRERASRLGQITGRLCRRRKHWEFGIGGCGCLEVVQTGVAASMVSQPFCTHFPFSSTGFSLRQTRLVVLCGGPYHQPRQIACYV